LNSEAVLEGINEWKGCRVIGYQIEQKMASAKEHSLWSTREKLFPEERRLNQLLQDCELMLEEMSLIEQAQQDSLQTVQIETSESGVA